MQGVKPGFDRTALPTMRDAGPIELQEVLASEYRALRPESDFACSDRQALFARVHREPQPFSALCISGGGIRSATFALGAIQGLATHSVLERFDYLSTVSGGGYIGGDHAGRDHLRAQPLARCEDAGIAGLLDPALRQVAAPHVDPAAQHRQHRDQSSGDHNQRIASAITQQPSQPALDSGKGSALRHKFDASPV